MRTKIIGLIAILSALVFLSAGFVSCKKDKNNDVAEIPAGFFYNGKQIPIQDIGIYAKGGKIRISFFEKKDSKSEIKSVPVPVIEPFLDITLLEAYLGETLELDKYVVNRNAWKVKVEVEVRDDMFSGETHNKNLMKQGSNMLIKIETGKQKRVSIVAKFVLPGKEGKADDILTVNYSGSYVVVSD